MVDGLVHRGVGVQAVGSQLFQRADEFRVHRVGVGGLFQVGKFLFQVFDLLRVGLGPETFFGYQVLAGRLYLVQQGLFFGVILGVHDLGALESHVLENVGQAGLAGGAVHVAYLEGHREGDRGNEFFLEDQQLQAVLKGVAYDGGVFRVGFASGARGQFVRRFAVSRVKRGAAKQQQGYQRH